MSNLHDSVERWLVQDGRSVTENPKERVRQLLEDYKKENGKVPDCNAESDLADV